uniref:Uncharacterized protein n=1 Tax=Anopheles melas TaxID=34690 RepID=A0A182TRR1_9DIPT
MWTEMAEISLLKLVTNIGADQNNGNDELLASAGDKVLLCVKNDTPTVVSGEQPVPLHSRALRELNTVPATVPPKPAASTVSRPVSVTASIFTSLPPETGASGTADKARAVNKPTGWGAPQSVTAKLFVTLPPPPVGAGIGGTTTGPSGSKPQHATEKIFAPRTEDMNKGFLMFSEEEPGLTSKYYSAVCYFIRFQLETFPPIDVLSLLRWRIIFPAINFQHELITTHHPSKASFPSLNSLIPVFLQNDGSALAKYAP